MTWLVRVVRRANGRLADERGMVTVEAAMALPVLVIVALAAVLAVQVGQLRLRCADAANQAARAIARGDQASADRLAERAAGRPVSVASAVNGDQTAVTVRLTVRPVGWLGPIVLTESAVVATEPAQAGPGPPSMASMASP